MLSPQLLEELQEARDLQDVNDPPTSAADWAVRVVQDVFEAQRAAKYLGAHPNRRGMLLLFRAYLVRIVARGIAAILWVDAKRATIPGAELAEAPRG